MHSITESYSEPRVPDGAHYTSVEARLSTVRIVYMQRFLNEFTEYLAGGRGGQLAGGLYRGAAWFTEYLAGARAGRLAGGLAGWPGP
jgi:hypothetical protein